MSDVGFNADIVGDRIDSGSLQPRKHAVIYALLTKMRDFQPTQNELLTLLAQSAPIESKQWLDRLWAETETLPLVEQGGLRLAVGLLHQDADLDWHKAEFYVLWGREQGLSDSQIGEAFGVVPQVG